MTPPGTPGTPGSNTPGTPGSETPGSAPSTASYGAASALSEHFDTRTAAMEVAEQLGAALAEQESDSSGGSSGGGASGGPDLVIVFGSYHHRAAFSEACETIRTTLEPGTLLGTTAEAVLGADRELDGISGLAAIAMNLGGARLKTWTTTPEDPFRLKDPAMMRERLGVAAEFRVAILLADPFTTPVPRLLPALTACGEGQSGDQTVPIIGGNASGGRQPGMNVLVVNDRVLAAGGVGVSILGDVGVDFVVSQGCKPIGKPLIVTKAQNNVIVELGSRPAMQALKEIAESLSEKDRALLKSGVQVGVVIDEYKERFGRGDFLIRNVLGFDQQHGAIAVGDLPRVGQTIQFHVRDAATAAEDLQLLLDAQQLEARPFGGLLFTCNGRGERLFGVPNHDLSMIHDRLGHVPVAGFFAAGEIGPIGKKSFLHGQTASLALFRGNV